MLIQFTLIEIRNKSCNESAFFYNTIRSSQGVASNRIQHNVDILRDVLKFLLGVINCHVGAQLPEEILVNCGRSRKNSCAPRLGDLNRERSDSARSSVNQHTL